MTSLPPFDYESAPDLAGALAAVDRGAVPIHGGTELLPAMSLGIMAPERIVGIHGVEELRVCAIEAQRLIVGAGLTHRDVSQHALIAEHAPILAEVAGDVGNIRVRSTGTIGGNLVFAEPRSDVMIALLALGADVMLASSSSQRVVPLAEFLVGPYEVDLHPGELLTAIAVDVRDAGRAVYRKIVRSERPVVGACLVRLATGRWRLVVGAAAMTHTMVEAANLDDLVPQAIAETVDATEDLGGSASYKQHLAGVVIERCCRAARVFSEEAVVDE
jgi:carbon-monoxide dehydrogenase medium subunit